MCVCVCVSICHCCGTGRWVIDFSRLLLRSPKPNPIASCAAMLSTLRSFSVTVAWHRGMRKWFGIGLINQLTRMVLRPPTGPPPPSVYAHRYIAGDTQCAIVLGAWRYHTLQRTFRSCQPGAKTRDACGRFWISERVKNRAERGAVGSGCERVFGNRKPNRLFCASLPSRHAQSMANWKVLPMCFFFFFC